MTKKQLIRLHIIFWSVTLFFICLQVIPSINKAPFTAIAAVFLPYTLSVVIVFYIYYFYVSGKHLEKKNAFLYIMQGIGFLFVITAPAALINIYINSKELFGAERAVFLSEAVKYYSTILESNFLFASSGTLMKLAVLWYKKASEQKEAEKKVFADELALLKSQINPQFFLSTLKDIKELIQSKPEKAIYCIELFSEILSYMLYETTAEKVYLTDDLKNIRNYINLQKAKYGSESIEFTISGEPNGRKIPPMAFLPLIEIIFLNVNFTYGQPPIDIRFIITGNNLLLSMTSYALISGQQLIPDSVKRQLFLQFGKNFALNIKQENNQNITELSVQLT